MKTPKNIDVYETILQDERKDRLSFWAMSGTFVFVGGLFVAALV